MFKKPPLPLLLAAVLYLGYLIWSLVTTPSWVLGARLILSALLFFFTLRGSAKAARILMFLSVISALVLLIAAIATFTQQPTGAVALTMMAGLLILFAAYLWRSTAVRAFQERSRADPSR